MKRYDIIISGGGMIGSIAAVAAINEGLSVLLIEAKKMNVVEENSPRDLRVSAISWDNIIYLRQLKIYHNLLQNRIQPYNHMKVWDNRTNAKIEFEADFSQQQCLGYLLENNNLVQGSWLMLKQSDRCDIIPETTIKSIENNDAQVRIILSNQDEFKGRLLIASEGRNSFCRNDAGIKTTEYPYKQKGLVAYITLSHAPVETALQAFDQGGPIGILPIKDDVFSIVWSLPEDKCDHWLECSPHEFEQGLIKAIGKDFGKIELLSQRAAFPLTQLYAEKYFKNHLVLCGDSAHGVHPLAGQGVNLGIGDVQLLFKLVNKTILKDQDLLHLALRKYQRRRMSRVKETSEMMSLLHHIFKDDKHFKKPLRTFALNIIDNIPFKKWFARQAGS